MRATNGRYFFAVLPFLVLAFVFPPRAFCAEALGETLVFSRCSRRFVNETMFFILKVIPFYR
jgi:hypothetical protein